MGQPIFTERSIIEHEFPILYVIHDNEGEWQFLSGNDVSVDEIRIITIEQILEYDKTLNSLLQMPKGYEAARTNIDMEWNINKSN